MKLKTISLFSLSILLSFSSVCQAQKKVSYQKRMQWFKDARLGIFIHWGLYSQGDTSESWPLLHRTISWEDYMEGKASAFTAANYHPNQWADLFKKVGASYVVMSSKHHDGFALWDTKYSKINAKDWSAAKRDVFTPYVNAIRSHGMKVGIYYSLLDWSHPDYTPIAFKRPEKKLRKLYPQARKEKYWTAWERFQKFNMGQLRELSTRYKPDLIWFDGDWEHHADEWPARVIKDSLLTWNPGLVVNSRLSGHGDYDTPEQDPPITTPSRPWELCLTLNDSWGYRVDDNNYKTPEFLIETFVRCVSKGGNLLLDIGPKADGTIIPKQVHLLEALGKWYQANKEAIDGVKPGIPYGHFDGETTISKDGKSLYLFQMGNFKVLTLRGIKGKITSIEQVRNKQAIPFKVIDSTPWNDIPGITVMNASNIDKDQMSVIKVTFEKPFSLYGGAGQKVELN